MTERPLVDAADWHAFLRLFPPAQTSGSASAWESRPVDDLGLDSLALVELSMDVADFFGGFVPTAEDGSWSGLTLGQIYTMGAARR